MEPDRWLGVELRHFLALEAVSREGSFGKAAAALGYTQSAVSQQIAALERIVGQRLVERPGGPKPVSLTEAGRLLLNHADAIAARVAAAQADLTALEDGEAGTLNVGRLPERRTADPPRGDAPLPARVAAGEGVADGVGRRQELLDARRARRPRPDVLRPAAARGPVRVGRAAARSLRARRRCGLPVRRARHAADRARDRASSS